MRLLLFPHLLPRVSLLALVLAGAALPPAGAQAQTVPLAAPSPVVVSPTPAPMPAAPDIVWSQVRVSGPDIAMTFDDGPHPALTPQLLDMLKQRNIHATFFVIGEMVKEHPELLKRAIAEGHEIANHSYSHPNLAKMSDEAVRSELNRTKDLITAAINRPVTMMRPPYGSLSKAQQRWVHDDLGYKIILWDVDPLDWKRPGPDAVSRRILEGTHKGSIILAHDIHPGTIQAMPATLDGLLAKGFKFHTVTELLAMELPPEPPKPGALNKGRPRAPAPAAVTTTPAGIPEKLTGTPEGTAVPAPAPAAATPTPVPTPSRH